MIRTVFLVITIVGIGALAGCSVFGVATKGELEAAMQQDAQSTQELQATLADLDEKLDAARAELAAVDRRITPRLASIDSSVASNTKRVDDATQHWTAMQMAMISHLDSLQTEFTLVERDIALVREGMTVATAQAASAHTKSRQAMQVHFENLTLERERLNQRLLELDQSLATWPAELDSVAAGAGGVADAGTTDAGKIDIRIVPETPADGAAASAGGS